MCHFNTNYNTKIICIFKIFIQNIEIFIEIRYLDSKIGFITQQWTQNKSYQQRILSVSRFCKWMSKFGSTHLDI